MSEEAPPAAVDAPGADPTLGLGFETRAIHAGQPPDGDDRGGCGADLPDIDLCPARGGGPTGVRVQSDGKPDADRPRGLRRRPRGNHLRRRIRQRAGGRGCRVPLSGARGPCHRRQRALRRDLPAPRSGALPDRPRIHPCLAVRRRQHPGCMATIHPHGLGGDPVQPSAPCLRHRFGGGDGPRPERAGGGGQHVRHALPPTACGPRRRHRRALDHQVSERAQRRRGWFRRHLGRGRGRAESPSSRTPPGRSPGHSTASSSCGASRRWRSAWTGTVRTPSLWPMLWPTTLPSNASTSPASPATSDTPRPRPRCGRSVAWSRSPYAAVRPQPLPWPTSTRIFTLAESLGAVESLIDHPHRMTHASLVDSPLAVDPALLRLSVGLELEADLINDLLQALDAGSGRRG